MVHYRGGPAAIDPAVYPDPDEFWHDLAAAYAGRDNQRCTTLGCTYLQLDDTSLAYLNDPAQRAELTERGDDAEHLHLRYIKQVNDAIKDKPADMTITTHLCRGNFRSSWAASGGYDFVAEALFGKLDVDGFFLEYDDERSGGFEPLRFVPEGKMVVLGLVTTKSGALENPDALKRRIEQASRTSRWTSCACPRSAASPRPWRATRSPRPSRSPSSSSSSRSPPKSGASQSPGPAEPGASRSQV